VKLSNSIHFDSIRFGSKSSAKRNRIFNFFLIFFQIFMIRFGRIELAIYPNKALNSIDSMQKRLLTRVRFGRTESCKFEKKSKKKLNIRNSFGRNFP
jgi:hypothetical protein